jgi:hypothetical protein
MLPPQLPIKGPFKRLYGWLNDLREVVKSQQNIDSIDSVTSVTALGTYRENRKSVGDSVEDKSTPRWG